jgi:hypothetical protein
MYTTRPIAPSRLLLTLAVALTASGCDTTAPEPCDGATVVVTPAEAQVEAGGQQQVTASVTDAGGGRVTCTVRWSARSGVGTIRGDGLFTAGTVAGVYARAVTATSGGSSATASVRTVAAPPASVVVTPAVAVMAAGDSVQFRAMGKDTWGNETSVAPTWAVPSDVGTIDLAGRFRGTRAGSWPTAITARIGSAVGTASLTVSPGELAVMRISPSSAGFSCWANSPYCGPVQFTATGEDRWGNAVPVTPVWSVKPGWGSISQTGVYTPHRTVFDFVTDEITATQGSISARATASIETTSFYGLFISPPAAAVHVGGGVCFAAFVASNQGNISVTQAATWTTSPTAGTISGGCFTPGTTPGTYGVGATWGGFSASASVVVQP